MISQLGNVVGLYKNVSRDKISFLNQNLESERKAVRKRMDGLTDKLREERAKLHNLQSDYFKAATAFDDARREKNRGSAKKSKADLDKDRRERDSAEQSYSKGYVG